MGKIFWWKENNMANKNARDYKKRIQTQNLIILALSILIVVMVFISSTAAWYIRTRSDTADIILSDPVNIYITEFTEAKDKDGNVLKDDDGNPIIEHSKRETQNILEGYKTRVYPGDKIKLRLGAEVVENSSPAYVRVKLQVVYENIYTGEKSTLQDIAELGQIEYVDAPDSDVWEKVDFNKYVDYEGEPENKPTDIWYVLKETKDGETSAKISRGGEQYVFVDGYITLNKLKITNAQANCKIHIYYAVEAIQIANVADPLQNEGIGPWWEHEDVYWDWED